MDEAETACTAARATADDDRQLFSRLLDEDIGHWALNRAEQKFLASLRKRRIWGRPLLANDHVHRRAQHAMIDAAVAEGQAHPERQWLWITLAWDTAVTSERAPCIDTIKLLNIARLHLMRSGLDGVGVLETDVWKLIAGEPCRRVVPHVHFLGFPTYDDRINVEGLEIDLCNRAALANSLGAKPAIVKEVGQMPADFAALGRYMFKRPTFAKNPVPKADGEGYDLKQVRHVGGSVARLVEIFSHMQLGDVLFSIGAGRAMASAVRREVASEVKFRRKAHPAPTRDGVARRWNQMRLTNGSRHFQPCSIITRKDQRGCKAE